MVGKCPPGAVCPGFFLWKQSHWTTRWPISEMVITGWSGEAENRCCRDRGGGGIQNLECFGGCCANPVSPHCGQPPPSPSMCAESSSHCGTHTVSVTLDESLGANCRLCS